MEMEARKGAVTFKGNPMTLIGPPLKIGDKLPEATLTAADLSPAELSSYRGRTLVVSTVPSLDTPVCDRQTRRFSEEAARLGDDIKIVTVSMDLPFAQKRWCGAAGVENMTTLSDYRDKAFARKTGLLIEELQLFARSVLIADSQGVVRYIQIVPEVSQEPDYESVLAALKEML